jgi:hypothetical protein
MPGNAGLDPRVRHKLQPHADVGANPVRCERFAGLDDVALELAGCAAACRSLNGASGHALTCSAGVELASKVVPLPLLRHLRHPIGAGAGAANRFSPTRYSAASAARTTCYQCYQLLCRGAHLHSWVSSLIAGAHATQDDPFFGEILRRAPDEVARIIDSNNTVASRA